MGLLHLPLSEKKAKSVAKLLANDTARIIMDAVSEESKSETQLAKELNTPLSTIHYNVQKLSEAGLLHSEEFTYSEKGKEMRHYKLASEHVLITTKPLAAIPAILGGILITTLTVGTAFFLRSTQKVNSVAMQSVRAAGEMAEDAAAPEAAKLIAEPVAANPVFWPYILLGAAAMLIGILLVYLIQRYRA